MKKHRTIVAVIATVSLLIMSLRSGEPDGPLTDQYIVIGWNDLGMHCANLDFSNMCILPPYNNQYVHVIRKGSPTQLPLVMNGASGIYVTYSIPGNTYSVGKTNFWSYSNQLFGVTLPPNVGLTGMGMSDTMVRYDTLNYQHADGIPITAFADTALGVEDPYQLTMIRAFSPGGSLLAYTQTVIPVAHEINCVSSGCHASELAILQKHDQVPGFNINQPPVFCANCHSDNALGMPGQPGVASFSQVIHMKHGEFIKTNTTADCYKCHPGPNTQCWRDVMHTTTGAITKCQDCHGSTYWVGKSIEEYDRRPWLDEPSCGSANCHGPQFAEEPGKLFRQSKGHGGLFCSTCHSSPHAILPTSQARDNVQNIALQGFAGTLSQCSVCHGYTPTGLGPHGIPAIKVVENVTVSSGQNNCYNATQHITLAGNGTFFTVSPGGSATCVSGGMISLLPGTTINQGGYFWGYITQKGRYCNSTLPPASPVNSGLMEYIPGETGDFQGFSLYPNPASGNVVVDIDGTSRASVTLRVFNQVGREVYRITSAEPGKIVVDMGRFASGIYLFNAVSGNREYSRKLIKQ